MIDIENDVYDLVESKATEHFGNLTMAGEYTRTPAKFPFASLEMKSTVPLRKSRTTDSNENHAIILFETNVCSNKKSGKKAECKKILAFIDTEMQRLGFTRIFTDSIPNRDDATIHRMVARYQAVVSQDKVIYRR